MRQVVSALLCITIIAVGCISIGAASDSEKAAAEMEQMCIPLGIITIAPPDTVEAKRTAVDFPHDLHFNFACIECHHEWSAGEEPIQSCSTSGCHELDTAPTPDSDEEPILYYKNAYHQLCLGCHKEIKIVNKKIAMTMAGTDAQIKATGPTGCVLCHPK